mmetsp:Transcript_120079/g.231593  ORF Transcript_120079/g.231593 Transcript_120079/m.231593 type:complete len:202 (+) Transcript_120079:1019-1624(+)
MQLTAACNDMLSALLCRANHQRVRLGQLLQAINKLWQVLAILALHRNLHDRRDTVLHVGNIVRTFNSCDCSGLEQVLIDSDKSNSVATWHISNLLLHASHHENCALDVLDVEILLATRLVMWTLDADFLSRGNGPTEDTTKGMEAALVSSWNHFRDIHHQGSRRVALPNGLCCLIILRSFIQILNTVLLGNFWRWQLCDNH